MGGLKTILVAGDTPRWINKTKCVLEKDYTLIFRHDFVGVVEVLAEDTPIDLCIVANKLTASDDGLRIATELNQPNDPKLILFTREINDEGRARAKKLGAIVVNMDDETELHNTVASLLGE